MCIRDSVITGGEASIEGGFTADSARELAKQLKFGALPMQFKLQTQDDISPTLGKEQLALGLLAGLIGLLLCLLYTSTVAEPFLVREGLVVRTPRGRAATPLAWDHLGLTPPAGTAAYQASLLPIEEEGRLGG